MLERRAGGDWVRAPNATAQALGVQEGMKHAAALARAGALHGLRRQPARERETLEALAEWSLQFTALVSLEPPDALVLEIGGSLRYFGGLPALRRRLDAGLAEQGFTAPQLACAPTPLAALWQARAGRDETVLDAAALPEVLGRLPVTVLPLADKARASLEALGLRRLSELLALPSSGLARRFGPVLGQSLARALGQAPDPRPGFEAPACFVRRLELGWPASDGEALLFLGRRLFAELAAFLDRRGLAVQALCLELEHDRDPPSRRALGFGQATACAQAMLLIWREELARQALPAPVTAMGLRLREFCERQAPPRDLFDDPARRGEPALWLARMRTRLGEAALGGLDCVADHRPERAWRRGEPDAALPGMRDASPNADGAASGPAETRPGWLLAEPEPLPLREERPWHGEALFLEGRAERIESGWWDGEPVRRDYYRAAGPSGRHYWIYQDRQSLAWFLHGLFA